MKRLIEERLIEAQTLFSRKRLIEAEKHAAARRGVAAVLPAGLVAVFVGEASLFDAVGEFINNAGAAAALEALALRPLVFDLVVVARVVAWGSTATCQYLYFCTSRASTFVLVSIAWYLRVCQRRQRVLLAA